MPRACTSAGEDDRDGHGPVGGRRQHLVDLHDCTRLTIGRQPTSDLALPWDEEVSRAHAELECLGDAWTVVDDGRSRNGSSVNGEPVHGRRPLHHGDAVRVGRTVLTFVAPVPAAVRSTAVAVAGLAPPVSPAQRRVLLALYRPFPASRLASPPSNAELAAELHLDVDTVKLHLRALFEAFRLDDLPQPRKRGALARTALELRVVEPDELLAP